MTSVSEEADADSSDAPAVVAIIVTHDAGPWLEESLESLGAQDYPNLSVLVIDAKSSTEALGRVAEVMPTAYVKRIDANPGFGAATNEVLSMVEGAHFLLLCHDDVRLEPRVVSLLVEEAYRSNAGILGPKLVRWDSPDRLLQVGLSADKTGVVSEIVDRGELDQEQHDAVRDVFVVPGGCMLVRADLFHRLGGFDPEIDLLGEDLDLCWRAHVAGARVLVVPDARVEHQEALASRRPVDDRRRLQARHRLRTMLSVYTPTHLLRVLPQAVLFTLAEMFYALISGHPNHAVDVVSAWAWNLRRWRELRRRRQQIRSTRAVGDQEIRRLQIRGSARLLGFFRGELGRTSPAKALEGARQELVELQESLSDSRSRLVPITIAAVVGVSLLGLRGLVRSGWPELGSISGFDHGPVALLTDYLRGPHAVGFDGQSPAPTASALIGLLGMAFFGAMGVLQHVLVLGAVPLGLVGIWRATDCFDSSRARLVTLVVYGAVPVASDSLAQGQWHGLVLYAAAPWMMSQVFQVSRGEPWDRLAANNQDGRLRSQSRGHPMANLGLILAVVAAFVPVAILVFIVMSAIALVSGWLVDPMSRALKSSDIGRPSPSILVAGASAIAIVANLPWLLALSIGGPRWETFAGIAPLGSGGASVKDLFEFSGGPHGSFLTLGLLLGGFLPLLIGKQWRFRAAAQSWGLVIGSWTFALVGQHGWLSIPLPGTEVFVSFGALGLALAVGLGMSAFENDLRGERFGWRQAASLICAVGVAIGVLPAFSRAIDGRAHLPESGLDRTLSFLDSEAEKGQFDIAWIGDSAVLPMAGEGLEADVALGISARGFPDLVDQWHVPASDAREDVERAMKLAIDGKTDRLGRTLSSYGIRYVALVRQIAPARANTRVVELPIGLERTFSRQLDLKRLDIDPAVMLFENAEWKMPTGSETSGAGSVEWWFVIVAVMQLIGWVALVRRAALLGSRVSEELSL